MSYHRRLNSRNGTFVNAHPVYTPTKLNHLDQIQIDEVLLIFDADDLSDTDNTDLRSGFEQVSTQLDFVRNTINKIEANMARVIQGKDDVIRKVLIALLSDGHVLLEDVPGVGKTKLAQALARSINTDLSASNSRRICRPATSPASASTTKASADLVFMPTRFHQSCAG